MTQDQADKIVDCITICVESDALELGETEPEHMIKAVFDAIDE